MTEEEVNAQNQAAIIEKMRLRIIDLESKLNKTRESKRTIYDSYMAEYLEQESSINFEEREARECYLTYLAARRSLGLSRDTEGTSRMFNKLVKERFPQLTIRHMYRNRENIYVWVNDGTIEKEY